MRNSYILGSGFGNGGVSFDLETSWVARNWDSPFHFHNYANKAQYSDKSQPQRDWKLLALLTQQEKEKIFKFSSDNSNIGTGKVRQILENRRGLLRKNLTLEPISEASRFYDKPYDGSKYPVTYSSYENLKFFKGGNSYNMHSRSTGITPSTKLPVFKSKLNGRDRKFSAGDETPSDTSTLSEKFSRLSTKQVTVVKKEEKKTPSSATARSLVHSAKGVQKPRTQKVEPEATSAPCQGKPGFSLRTTTGKPAFKTYQPSKTLAKADKAEGDKNNAFQTTDAKAKPSFLNRPVTGLPQASHDLQKRRTSAGGHDQNVNKGPERGDAGGRGVSESAKLRPKPKEVPEGMAQCPICNRNFIKERIDKHSSICKKTSTRKKKVFEPFLGKLIDPKEAQMLKEQKLKRLTIKKPAPSDWRKKHEEFLKCVQAARDAKLHVLRGGKLSDLPPPPPSENAHYVPCPHCSRKFDPSVAERHIPKCANIRNRPAPAKKAPPKRA